MDDERCTLETVLARVSGEPEEWNGAVGFAYAVTGVAWLRQGRDGGVEGPPGVRLGELWPATWQLYLFTPERELRWTHEEGGAGAVREFDDASSAAVGLERLDARSQRLLWGESTGDGEDGWTRMYSGRVEDRWVPVPGGVPPRGGRVALRAVEYLSTDAHGNVAVAAERLSGLEVFR